LRGLNYNYILMDKWGNLVAEVNKQLGRRIITAAELYLILHIINEMEYVGRYYLSEKLNLGETTIRNILNILKQLNIIEAYRGGHRLTPYGQEIIEELSSLIEIYPDFDLGVSGESVLFVVKNFSDKIGSVLEFRDDIIRAGGRGAVILVYRDGNLIFPDSGQPVSVWRADITDKVREKTVLNEGDVVIIVSSENQKEALLSGLNTILAYLSA